MIDLFNIETAIPRITFNKKNSSSYGLISEMKFLIKCLSKNWEITKPLHHSYPYDFVIKRGLSWETVQVKTACFEKSRKYQIAKVKLRRTGNNGNKVGYEEGDFDLLGVIFKDYIWLIPWEYISKIKDSFSILQSKYDCWRI